MTNLNLRQTNWDYTNIAGKLPEPFCLDQVAVRAFWKCNACAVNIRM